VQYLKSIGIGYEFVKENNGISTYKYKKSSGLFEGLGAFYRLKESGMIKERGKE
jgi:hypothetical protein